MVAGRYRLVSRIAVGGMGVVWEGWDELLARQVAVKQLLTQPGLSEADALLARHRVIREARITARLHHPHAVTIYDVVDDGDSPCLIMQFVRSSSLNTVLRTEGTLPPSRVGRIGADLASALQAAHEVGIVHRDVKPGNVLITGDGSAKLTDFGISHAVGDVTLTSTGMVSGTPAYLAPEVARGGESGFAADVFSLGATMYASLEGTPPFGLDPNPMAVLHRVASGQPIPPRQSGPLTPLLLAMMAPEPADRPTMAEVTRSLTLPQLAAPSITPRGGAGSAESVAVRTVPVPLSELSAALAADPRTPEPASPAPDARPGGSAPLTDPARAYDTPGTSFPGAPAHPVGPAPSVDLAGDKPRTDSGPPALAALLSPARGASEPADAPARRRRIASLVAVAVVLIAAVLATGFLLVRDDDSAQQPVPATSLSQTSAVAESPSPETTVAQSSAPAESAASAGASTAESASSSAEPVDTAPTDAELAAAVSGYYALMPGNTDAGWALLTPSFQSGIAENRDYYERFWSGVAQVGVSDVTATPPGTVEATVTYTFTDGSVSVERTSYQLVDDGGALKIDSSSVLTSQSG